MNPVRRAARTARRTATRHARATVLLMAALGLALAGVLDAVAFDTVARFPITANLVAGLLGAPAVLALAMLFLDRFTAAERRRGWVARNQRELHDDVPSALGLLEVAVAESWPLADAPAIDDLVNTMIPDLEAFPRAVERSGLASALTDLQAQLRPLAGLLRQPSVDQLDDACTAVHRALEPLALQSDAPRLAEVAVDLRTRCAAVSSSAQDDGYLALRFARWVSVLAVAASSWQPRGEYLVVSDDTSTQRISPAGMARPGFAYLRQLHLATAVHELIEALRREIVKTV